MKGLAELLGDGAGRDRLAAAGIHVDPAAFLAAMPAGRPARIYCHQQPAGDPRRSVMAKLTALDGLRLARPDGVEPLFLRIDTDRAASAKAATRLAWEDAAGRRHLLKLTPPGTDRLESRHLQLDPQHLTAVAARLEAYVRQAPVGRQEALARLDRIRPLLAPGRTMALSRYAAALSDGLLARVDVRLPTAFVSELGTAGALTGGLTRLLAGRDAFVAAFDRAVDDLRQAGIATAVSPLPDDYLPLFYSCPHEGERLRLRRVAVGGEIQAVAVGTTGRRHVFPLGRRGDDPGALLATQRWSPDVTLPVLLNDTFDGVVAGRSSALYLMVLAAAMRAALGMRPIPVLVPAELGTVPERPDGLLQRWLMG